jgi:hypothetical protein
MFREAPEDVHIAQLQDTESGAELEGDDQGLDRRSARLGRLTPIER